MHAERMYSGTSVEIKTGIKILKQDSCYRMIPEIAIPY
jgi:hypothetical protein